MFECRSPGLYFFSFSARGRWNFGFDENYIDSNLSSEENRRIQLTNLRSRAADREACFDWKYESTKSAFICISLEILQILCYTYFFRVSLILNTEPVISMGGQNNTSSSNSIILPLNRGDRVYLQLLRGQIVELNDNSYSFRG